MRFFIAAIFAISAWLFLGTTPINSQQIGVKNDSPIDTIGYAVWMDSVDVLISSRKLDQAQVLLDSLKLVCIQELGEKSPEFADILSQMARIKNFSYQAQEAIALNKAALAIRQLHFEAHSMPIYLTYESLGINYYYDAQFQAALAYFHKMEAIVLQQDPQEEEEIASTFNLLGLTYNALTDFESAIVYFQKTLEIRKRIYGETHELVGISYNNLAGEFDELGDYNRAIAYKLKALSIIEKNTGNQNEFYATTAANIGVSNYEKGDYDQAIYWIK